MGLVYHHYLEDKTRFRFRAPLPRREARPTLKKGETVAVRRLAPEGACSSGMPVLFPAPDFAFSLEEIGADCATLYRGTINSTSVNAPVSTRPRSER
jgi:hypothetical protein